MPIPPQYAQLASDAERGNPEAQFILSEIYRQSGDLDAMLHWLREASANGVANAIGALGQCYEKGRGVAIDPGTALEHYERAIAAGSAPAAWDKSQLLYKTQDGREQDDLIRSLLVTAAEAGVPPALRTIGYLAMQRGSDLQLARACLHQAASRGDAFSGLMLRSLPGDTAEMTGTTPIDFAAPFALYPEAPDVAKEIFNEDLPVVLFRNVLDTIDCTYLAELARPQLKRAHVINPEGDKSGMVSTVRTSMSTYLPVEALDIISRYIELKIILATGGDLRCSEPMSILRYAPGEYYRPHVDYFDPKLEVSREFLEDGGQRTASAVTYLVAPDAGGGTSFPNLDLTVPPAFGATLWFRNCDQNGAIDKRSVHAGDTVITGEKWVVTKWFRERPTSYLAN